MKLQRSLLSLASKLAVGVPFVSKPVLRTMMRAAGRPQTGRFFVYVIDFEIAYESDAWDDVEPYFAPDAIYEVRNTPFDCRLEGSRQIIDGFKRCLDSFDRHFERRLWIVEGPSEREDLVTFLWRGRYARAGHPPLRFEARQTARYRHDLIIELTDEYSPGVGEVISHWLEQHGQDLAPSYL